ncbi:DNA phosphorothioation-associated putative methyltransferase, partial [Candidatus Poribacteria bacterium]|nr:DNA phosphorothioation-associated putative methyltransferase [Candidatus Poribacteria bacterium]
MTPVTIDRHRTALRRSTLSSPFQHLLRFGFLDGTLSVFDYGCGRGDDLRLLRAMGIRADGWDPIHRNRARHRTADIVNFGFVLNVIEDPEERKRTIRAAFALAGKVMVASVMVAYRRRRERFDAYRDGVRTARNTFQKYYTQDEFRAYVESTLDARAIAVAPGICIIFRDPADEQLFLLARQQVRREWRMVRRDVASEKLAPLVQRYRDDIDTYWRNALELGRPPLPEECPAARSLAAAVGSGRRVHWWVSQFFSPDEIEAAALGRQEDLLVYFALGHFSRRKPYT